MRARRAGEGVMTGLGTDIVSVARMRRLHRRHPERLPARILHADEMSDYHDSHDKGAFLARRFAAKEAVAKALGGGFQLVAARRIAIRHDRCGKPTVKLPENVNRQVLVSIADEREYATATALAL